jgi:hypothetical protein
MSELPCCIRYFQNDTLILSYESRSDYFTRTINGYDRQLLADNGRPLLRVWNSVNTVQRTFGCVLLSRIPDVLVGGVVTSETRSCFVRFL